MLNQIEDAIVSASEPMSHAIRILTRFNNGLQPTAEEVEILKQHPAWVKKERLRVDDLAWKVIRHELQREKI